MVFPVRDPFSGHVTVRPMTARPERATRPTGRPAPVLLAVLAALGAQALLLLGVAVLSVLAWVQDDRVDGRGAVATALFALAFAALLVGASRGLLQGRRWARGPVVTVQLLALLAVAAPMLVGGPRWLGAVVGVLALTVLVGLFTRPVVEHTTRSDADPPTL